MIYLHTLCVMLCFECMCFLNITATTKIYTYLHTLSLLDALPICLHGQLRSGQRRHRDRRFHRPGRPGRGPVQQGLLRKLLPRAEGRRHTGAAVGVRSEEHTSELQAIMRSSYAVFCIKKKKNTNSHQITLSHKNINTATN